jgi:hypothetical protein
MNAANPTPSDDARLAATKAALDLLEEYAQGYADHDMTVPQAVQEAIELLRPTVETNTQR